MNVGPFSIAEVIAGALIASGIGLGAKLIYDRFTRKAEDIAGLYCPDHHRCLEWQRAVDRRYETLNNDYIKKVTQYDIDIRSIKRRLDKGDEKMENLSRQMNLIRTCLEKGFSEVQGSINVLVTKVDAIKESNRKTDEH